MKSATLITRDGGTVAVYYDKEYTEVVAYNDDLNMHLIDNDLNMANEVVWLTENQAALRHKKVLEDAIRLEAEKESLQQNDKARTDVRNIQVDDQVKAQCRANDMVRSAGSGIAVPR